MSPTVERDSTECSADSGPLFRSFGDWALCSDEPVDRLEFVKSHGLGNDFVLTETAVSAERARAICLPRRGVGADGVISVEQSDLPDASVGARITIRNADGSRPEMCGNGLRCVVRYLAEETDKDGWDGRGDVTIETDAGQRQGRIRGRQSHAWNIEVSMGVAEVGELIEVDTPTGSLELRRVDVGNPHAVARGSDLDVDEIAALGEHLNDDHEAFPEGVNLEVIRPTTTDRQVVVVYERGVGLTDACGSGACAVAAAVWTDGDVEDGATVDVELPGGVLSVDRDDQHVLWLTGPATKVFEGRLMMTALPGTDD